MNPHTQSACHTAPTYGVTKPVDQPGASLFSLCKHMKFR